MLTALRGCIVGLILHCAADLDPAAKQGSASLTLITADAARINAAFEMLHDLWATPIEIGFALWLLARELGVGAVGPAIVVLGKIMSQTHMYCDCYVDANGRRSNYGNHCKDIHIYGTGKQIVRNGGAKARQWYIDCLRRHEGDQDARPCSAMDQRTARPHGEPNCKSNHATDDLCVHNCIRYELL